MEVFNEHPALTLAILALPFAVGFAARRREARALWRLGAALVVELGFVGTAMILVHIGFIASEPLRDWGAFEYDFHYYAMWLFGLLNLTLAIGVLRTAGGWARGERPALLRAVRLAVLAVLLNGPVWPLQEFAGLFTIGATVLALVAAGTARTIRT